MGPSPTDDTPRLTPAAAPVRPTRLALLVLACLVTWLAGAAPAAASSPCGPPVVNPVACENTLPGDAPSDWQPNTPDDPSIVGFATSMSVNVGQTESFKINTLSTKYHIDILRLGYYGGDGARMIQAGIKPSVSLPQVQPACVTSSSTGEIDCGNWGVSASWTVPSNAVSGVYVAHLVRDDASAPPGDASHIVFVVRNDSSHSAILMQTSDATWQAYNQYGGNSLYTCVTNCPPGNSVSYKNSAAVSYNRPFFIPKNAQFGSQETGVWWAEYQLIYFLEENGYDLSYTSESQQDSAGSLLTNHKLFISSGHDEYWSASQRQSVVNALNAGVNLAFFSGNEMFWKTRWGPSIDGSNTPDRTIITYKETNYNQPMDPNDPPTWTGTWRDPRFSPPADGGQPENAVTGQFGMVDTGTTDITVPYQYSKLRLWRNTSVASLSAGQSATLDPGGNTLGHEWDVDADNGFRPAGEFDLSSTTVSGVHAFTNDYGSVENDNATATHHLSLYRAASGALVFGAGTIQWAWGLTGASPAGGTGPDPTMQQATVNLFADMGIQPATLMSGLAAASASADTTAPKSTITSPAGGSTINDSTTVTITGTATDSGGGVVAGVEISTDGGSTWHPATLTTADGTTVNWSYTWGAHGYPNATIETRATDDSGNLETPSDAISVKINCPCSLWGSAFAPLTVDAGDSHSTELGLKFTADLSGQVTGISFYKASGNTGTHVGSLWTAGGALLAQATFTGESASGWQTVKFSSPVNITGGSTYVAAYFAPNGHYSSTPGYFYPAPSPPGLGGGVDNSGPLHAVPNATSANGLYSYSSSSSFPTATLDASNYWVDVLFAPGSSPSAPGAPTGVSAAAGNASATVSWTAPGNGGSPITSYSVTPYIGTSAQTPTSVSGSSTSTPISGLTNGTAYTFTVSATNAIGTSAASTASNSITPTAGATAPGAPTGVSASPASSQALVSWTAPANNGGSAITGYVVTPYIGSAAQTALTVNNGSAVSAVVSGLSNGSAYTFTVAATNAVGTGSASAQSTAVVPEDTILDFSGTPTQSDSGDSNAVNLGVKFTASSGGQVTGIRFLKAAANTGTHVGSLWSASGALLAQATFTGESASGWQTVLFSSPVAITAGTTYVASYLAPAGHYSSSQNGFAAAVTNGPLQALGNATSANGLYAYGATSTFPTNSYNATNYWVDVLFAPGSSPSAPGAPTGVSAAAGNASATVSWTAPGNGGSPITSYSVTPYIGTSAQTPTSVSGSSTSTPISGLTNGTAYTFTVSATNAIGTSAASTASNSITPTAGATAPGAPTGVSASPASSQALVSWTAPANNGGSAITGYVVTPYIGSAAQTALTVNNGSAVSAVVSGLSNGSAYTFTVAATNAVGTGSASAQSTAVVPEDTILDFSGTPTQSDSGDSNAVNLGVKFTASSGGQVTGIRFLKAAANTGTHVGSLWSATGALLAQATFTGESASGWQTVLFSSPVAITAGTTYVASYLAPAGHYSSSQNGFAAAVTNGPLQALGNATSANGLYAYGATSTFPTNSYNATNYWVDVLFAPGSSPSAPGAPTGVSAAAGNASATVSWTAPGNGGSPITSYSVTPYIGTSAQTPTSVSGSSTSTPISGLTNGTAYTFTVSATNAIGTSAASTASNSITPTAGATAPGAPTGVSASPASSQALVSWTAPANNGGSAITGYVVTPYIGSAAQTALTVNNGSAVSAVVSGLSNGSAYTFTVAATNAVGTGSASAQSTAVVPEDTILDFSGTPTQSDSGDSNAVNLGVKFTASSGGQVTGIRFLKAAANTGTHVGSLWSATGALLAQATFTGESASGWQTVLFSSPVAITAGTTYVASYLAPAGHYSSSQNGFAAAVTNGPLQALGNATSANGLYAYGATSTFPTNSYNATNYWVDVLFAPGSSPSAPGAPTGVSAAAGNASATVSWTAPGNGGSPITSYSVTPYIGTSAQTPTSVSGSSTSTPISGLTNGTAYTFTVSATNAIGTSAASTASNSITPTAGATAPGAPTGVSASPASSQALVSWTAPSNNGGSTITSYTITPYLAGTAKTPVLVNSGSATSATVTGLTNGSSYTFAVAATNGVGTGSASAQSTAVVPEDTILDFSGTPIQSDSGDTTSVNLGVKFTSTVNGHVTGIRFLKAATNTGTHVASLWSATGALLAQTPFTGETTSGWQTALFTTPVAITAGTTYIASYLAPNGHYSASQNGFASAVTNGPLQALANGTSANGVYAYGSGSSLPNLSYNATNYWVDVLFTTN